MEKGNNNVIFFFSFLVELSKLFPKANNMEKCCQISLCIYDILSIGGSSIFFSHFFQGAWTSRLTPQSFVRVCISLSISLYIPVSPDPQHHLVKTQNSTISRSVNKLTAHQISKGILWPVSVIHYFMKSSSLSSQSCQNIQLQKRDLYNAIFSNPARDFFWNIKC